MECGATSIARTSTGHDLSSSTKPVASCGNIFESGPTIRGFYQEDEPEYPYEALCEAVVNAVVHRDYSRSGETMRVFMFPDRVEVRSPGGLPPS